MRASKLTSGSFRKWRKRRGISAERLAQLLGISKASVDKYEKGERKEGKVLIPYLVALGLAAIAAGLVAYEDSDE